MRLDWPAPAYEVRCNVHVRGSKSHSRRQIEAAAPFLLIEAKRRGRAIDLQHAGATIALVQDVGRLPTIMVSSSGYSSAAIMHLEAEGIQHLTLTLTDAAALRWVQLVESYFLIDAEYRVLSGRLVEALRVGDCGAFLDLETPSEEWLATMYVGLDMFADTSRTVLLAIAAQHYDDGVRWNAINLAEDHGFLSARDLEVLVAGERNSEILELLNELRGA